MYYRLPAIAQLTKKCSLCATVATCPICVCAYFKYLLYYALIITLSYTILNLTSGVMKIFSDGL